MLKLLKLLVARSFNIEKAVLVKSLVASKAIANAFNLEYLAPELASVQAARIAIKILTIITLLKRSIELTEHRNLGNSIK